MQEKRTIVGTTEKLIERFCNLPKDFTFSEMERLLSALGFTKDNKGRTSGSRIVFKAENKMPIMLHRPHPGNIVKGYAMRQVYDILKGMGILK